MIFKNGILKCVVSAIVAAIAIGEARAVSTSPINPAFLRWKKHDNKIHLPGKPVNRPKLLSANLVEPIAERPMGQLPDLFDSSYLSTLNFNVNRGVSDTLPSSYDLRQVGGLTPVRDQGEYGTCWAHASCSSLESWLLQTTGQAFDFSENNLANLHGFDWGFDDGGNASLSQAYFLRWCGPVLESDDPYPNPGGSVERPPARHVQRVRWIPGRTMYLDNDAIKAAVLKYGALHVSYYHDSSFYNASKAAYYLYLNNPQRNTNHAVALVGWDDNYSKSNFGVTPPGNGAFIVRNNWGSSWGDAGYFYVSYYDESFAWDRLYAFTDAEPSDNYDGIYQYDQLGLIGSVGYNSTSAWGAGMFTSTDGAPVAAVGFYALVPSVSYTIRIYVGCSAGMPSSGTLAHEQTGKTDELGYWTIPLIKSVSVNKGQRFAVVLKLTTPEYNYPLGYEYAYAGFSSAATAKAGETFLSSNGTSWSDFTEFDGTASFCCKAYTKSAAPAKTLSSVGITGVNSLRSGKSAQFACKAKYSDGSDLDITKTTSWSIASGSAYASIDSTGLVTAKSVTQQQTVKVHAEYTEGGVTKNDDWSFYVTIAPPEPPTSLAASQGTDAACVRVAWTASAGASSYSVYRGKTASGTNAQHLHDVSVPKSNDKFADPGVKFYYFVKAKNDSGSSGFSAGAQGWKALSAPDGVTASDGTSLEYVEVTWTAAPGAKYYHVYRSDDIDGEKTPLGSWQAETTYRDTTATPGKVYFYAVKSAIDSCGNMASAESIFDEGSLGVPVTLDFLAIDGPATIVSGGNATYTCTATYTDKSTRSVARPSWTIIAGGNYATVDSSGKVTAKIVSANQSVTLQASYTDGVNRKATKQITVMAAAPSAPSSVTLVSATTESVVISWSPVDGAAGYSVWRGGSTSDAQKIADVGAMIEYADESGTPGVSYRYWVKASNAAGESGFSTTSVTAARILPAPTGVIASDGAYADKTLVSWNPVAGATHYRVARSASSTASPVELGGWQTGIGYEDKSGAAGTHYWYFVKAATRSDGANASEYSSGDEGWCKASVTLSSIVISGATKLTADGSTVLTCTAMYSDNSTKAVDPEWSVSPTTAATIGADGKLTAKRVTDNVTVTVTARFTDGTTKTDTHEIVIVAPIMGMADVKNVQISTRWPFGSLLDVDYDLETSPSGTRATVTLAGFDRDKNAPLYAESVMGEGADGAAVAAGHHRLSWDVAADFPGLHTTALEVTLTAVPFVIQPPESLEASIGETEDTAVLTWGEVEDAVRYEVWRGTSSETNGAARVATTSDCSYNDVGLVAGTTYYYWVRSVGASGTSDFGEPAQLEFKPMVVVTFNANGGSCSTGSRSVLWSATLGTLPTATRSGYEFFGWYTAASGGTQVSAETVVNADVTYYAHWYEVSALGVQLWENGPYWAECNVGASKPEESGYYFWWGDTVGYTTNMCIATCEGSSFVGVIWVPSTGALMSSSPFFSSSTCPTYGMDNLQLQSAGFIDSSGNLVAEHDAATAHLGAPWRMPTDAEFAALEENCTTIWTMRNGVYGRLVTGKDAYSSKNIFLPAGLVFDSGRRHISFYTRRFILDKGGYWSSSTPDSDNSSYARSLSFGSSYFDGYRDSNRYAGCSVRPVIGFATKSADTVVVTFNANGGNCSTGSRSYFSGGMLGGLPTATRTGYEFFGWFTAASGGVRVTTEMIVNANVTYYAHWQKSSTLGGIQLWENGPYWAECNVGASKPDEYGCYFCWGDTVGYKRNDSYDGWVSLKDGSPSSFTPGTCQTEKGYSQLQSEGYIDSTGNLAAAHDAATVHLGAPWRMPTDAEFSALISNCTIIFTETPNYVNGAYVYGLFVIGKGAYSSKSIFLPAAGYGFDSDLRSLGSSGYYWSSTPYSGNTWYLYFYPSSFLRSYSLYRFYGQSVRPLRGFAQ